MSIEQTVIELITRFTGNTAINTEDRFDAVLNDELEIIELIWGVEEELGMTVPLDVIDDVRTVGDLIATIESLKNPPLSTSEFAPTDLAPQARIAWAVRYHLANASDTTVDKVDAEWDLSDDMGVPELTVGFFVFGFISKHFGFDVDLHVANGVMKVQDLIDLVVHTFETAGLDCVCAAVFLSEDDSVASIACIKECPRKRAMIALGGLPPSAAA